MLCVHREVGGVTAAGAEPQVREWARVSSKEYSMPNMPQDILLTAYPAPSHEAGVWQGAAVSLPILPSQDQAALQSHASHC